jgi:methionyl-tRNA formyltransferase
MIRKINEVICLAGKNEIAVYGLHLLLRHVKKTDIRVICNATDDGLDTWQPSLRKLARENDIKVITLEDCYIIDNLVFLSLEFDKIISPQKFFNARLYNIHFSKLPAYKGMYTSALPLLNGENDSGVTLHEIDAGIDTGDVIDQIVFPIEYSDTARHLYGKYLVNSKNLLEKNIIKLLDGNIKSTHQSAIGATYFSKRAVDYRNVSVDLVATANQIVNQIRAFTFPEYQVPKVGNFFVSSAAIKNTKSFIKPGTLLAVTETELHLSSIDYDVVLYRDKDAELLEAAENNNVDVVLKCINCGVDINKRNGKGWTPLIVASFNGAESVMEVLIEAGADTNKPNYKGTTPLMYAMSNYEKSRSRLSFDLLLKHRADVELHDVYNKTIQDYARQRNVIGLFEK